MDLKQLVHDPGAFPSIPRVIALVMNELGRADPDLRRISAHLKEDPVMTARLLAIANSSRFNLSRGVSSVGEALPLLGLGELREMVHAAAVASALRQVGGVNMTQFWRYSLNTAKLARKLAMVSPYASTAFTAGLVHAAGELIMHRALPRQMAELDAMVPVFDLRRAAEEKKFLGYSYAEVGGAFARSWKLPSLLIDVLERHVEPLNGVDGLGQEVGLAVSQSACITAMVHLAAWRARAQEANLNFSELLSSFPQGVASALHLDSQQVLDAKAIDWTSQQEVQSYL
jgi:HD-like signal output (HDOD) protein